MGHAPGHYLRDAGAIEVGRWLLAQCPQGAQQQGRGLILGQRGRAVGLAQFVPVRLGDQRYMQVAGLGKAQQFLQVQLARCGIQQVGAAHDISDALPGIVEHHANW